MSGIALWSRGAGLARGALHSGRTSNSLSPIPPRRPVLSWRSLLAGRALGPSISRISLGPGVPLLSLGALGASRPFITLDALRAHRSGLLCELHQIVDVLVNALNVRQVLLVLGRLHALGAHEVVLQFFLVPIGVKGRRALKHVRVGQHVPLAAPGPSPLPGTHGRERRQCEEARRHRGQAPCGGHLRAAPRRSGRNEPFPDGHRGGGA
mmetsp:Transcript_10820/g.28114  ORF Transcript_10820/g.28114 Transcript_10820/m.28114 type:complete len:209 (+) Transcript_10820:213-839(+)